jgi:hypothetical protein
MDLQPVSLSELLEVEGGGHHKNDGGSNAAGYNVASGSWGAGIVDQRGGPAVDGPTKLQ